MSTNIRILVTVMLLLLLVLLPEIADGDEFLIDTRVLYGSAEGNQTNPKAACAFGLNYLVVWEDCRGVDYDIYGARINVFGNLTDSAGIPIATGIGQQDQPAVAFDGNNYLVVWRENTNLYGVRVSTDGVILDSSPFTVSSAAYDQSNPNICFGDTTYLVVWQDNRNSGINDIYGTRIKTDGTVLDSDGIAISTASEGQTYPSVAFGDTNFVVVWGDDRNGVSNYDVYGARVNQSGTVIEPLGFQIAHDESFNEQRPSVAYNSYMSGYYLVVWEDYRGPSVDIYGTRVFHDGTVIDDPVNIAISTADNTQETPVVCSRGEDFFVVWKDRRGGILSQTIYGSRVGYSGAVTDPSGIPISYSFEFSYPAAVVYGIGEYLVVHGFPDGTQYDIFGRFLDINGIITGDIDLTRSANSQTYADAAFDGTNYLAVWQDWRYDFNIYGALIDQSGSLVDTVIGICTASDHQYHPQVAFDGTNYLVVWENRDGDTSRTYGSRVTKAGVVLDGEGVAICTTGYYQHNPAVAFDGTNYVVVWDHQNNIHCMRLNTSLVPFNPTPGWITTDYISSNPSITFGDRYYLVAFEQGLDFPFNNIYAKRIRTDGDVVDLTAIEITSDASAGNPSTTFDGTNFMVTWEDEGIYAAQLDTHGTVLGSKGIPVCSKVDAGYSDVAFDGVNYLVIWREPEPVESFFDVWAAKLSPAGEKIDSFAICARTENQILPVVAAGPEEQLLVVFSSFTDSIYGRSANAMRVWGKLGGFSDVGDETEEESRISSFQLKQNYPNPFNSNTQIQYSLPRATQVEVSIYNLLGQNVRTLYKGEQSRGNHTLSWDGKDYRGRDVGSGIYFYRLKTSDGATESRKMLFLK